MTQSATATICPTGPVTYLSDTSWQTAVALATRNPQAASSSGRGYTRRRTAVTLPKIVAWVRNWTDAWAALPYLDSLSEIWCSSNDSAAEISKVYAGHVEVVPLATDPGLFVNTGAMKTTTLHA